MNIMALYYSPNYIKIFFIYHLTYKNKNQARNSKRKSKHFQKPKNSDQNILIYFIYSKKRM